MFTHLKLCLATAAHNFKRVKIIHICLHLQILTFKHTFFPNNYDFILIKRIKNDYSRD